MVSVFDNTVSHVCISIAPSLPPQFLSVTVTSSVSVLVSWSPPPSQSHNGIIRQYTVIMYNTLYGTEQSFTTINTALNVSVLTPYTKYSVKVAAETVSLGPYSDFDNITTLQDGMLHYFFPIFYSLQFHQALLSHLMLLHVIHLTCSCSGNRLHPWELMGLFKNTI